MPNLRVSVRLVVVGVALALGTGLLVEPVGNEPSSDAPSTIAIPDSPIIHVDGGNPIASDKNPGNAAGPLETIGEAVRRAQVRNEAGLATEIMIRGGVYRESIQLAENARATEAPISIRGLPEEEVVISGADVWGGWTEMDDDLYQADWPFKWGVAPIPGDWRGTYAEDDLEANPLIRRREMVFVGGNALTQVASTSELRRTPGTFLVSEREETVYLRLPEGASLSQTAVEVAVRPTLFEVTGRRNITIENLSFVRANSPLQRAAVSFVDALVVRVLGSRFLWNNGVGLRFVTSDDVVVRRSLANHNGSGGMRARQSDDLLFEDTETSYNNWRGIRGAERVKPGQAIDSNFVDFATGQKFSRLRRAIFRRHSSVGNLTGGLWFDFDNSDVALDGVVLKDNLTHGVFVEASQGPLKLSNSFICGNETGVLISNSAMGDISHTLIGSNLVSQIFIAGRKPRSVNDVRTGETRRLTSERWDVYDNILGMEGGQLALGTVLQPSDGDSFTKTLKSDRNVYLHDATDQIFQLAGGKVVDLNGWRTYSGQDSNSIAERGARGC